PPDLPGLPDFTGVASCDLPCHGQAVDCRAWDINQQKSVLKNGLGFLAMNWKANALQWCVRLAARAAAGRPKALVAATSTIALVRVIQVMRVMRVMKDDAPGGARSVSSVFGPTSIAIAHS